MEYVDFGQTGVKVSQIAFGAMELGRKADDQEAFDRRARSAVARAFELGINLFDTADVYGRGKGERVLGEALREHAIPREEVLVASKCAILFPGDDAAYTYKAYDTSAGHIKRSCEASLERLGLERIDLYQLHRIDYLTHPAETARALEDLKAEGKIRWAAVSNYTADEIRALSAYVRLESLQAKFSLLHLEPLETGLAPVCHEKGMSMLCYSPLGAGILAGAKPLPHNDWHAQRQLGIVTQLAAFALKYEATPGQIALAWLMTQPGGVIPLVGTSNPDHIAEAAAAVDLRLARDDWYEMLVIARGRRIPWEQPPYAYLRER